VRAHHPLENLSEASGRPLKVVVRADDFEASEELIERGGLRRLKQVKLKVCEDDASSCVCVAQQFGSVLPEGDALINAD
jgi:hypothetical protein